MLVPSATLLYKSLLPTYTAAEIECPRRNRTNGLRTIASLWLSLPPVNGVFSYSQTSLTN